MFDGIDVNSFKPKYTMASSRRAILRISPVFLVLFTVFLALIASMKRIKTQVPSKFLNRYVLLPLITDIHLESFMACTNVIKDESRYPSTSKTKFFMTLVNG